MACGALHSANKKHKISSVRSLEDYAFAKILLFKNSSDNMIPSDSDSSKSELGCFHQKCGIPFHPRMYNMNTTPKIIIELLICAI
jgi:hypothetical protein